MLKMSLKHFFLILFLVNSSVAYTAGQDTSLQIGNQKIAATWYEPNGQALGWIHLQHGFARNRGNMEDLAETFQANGYLVLTTNITKALSREQSFISSFADFVERTKGPEQGGLPDNFVLVGHSVGGEFSLLVAAELYSRGKIPAGVLMLDMVPRPAYTTAAFKAIDSKVNMLAILAKPSSCNANNGLIPLLDTISTPFKGFQLTSGSHCDAEGDSSDAFCDLICGASDKNNVDIMFDFSVRWIDGWLANAKQASYYPDGMIFEKYLSSGQIQSLK
tara:strand:- start:15 stop:842 length:828 start_codon:yes stop_codon:yes gene_type:complete